MTPKRKAALQWFYDRGEVTSLRGTPFGNAMLQTMIREGQVQWVNPGRPIFSLTDKGRRMLNGEAE